MNATDYNAMIQDTTNAKLQPILASEVIKEFEFRCANGMQYTTFPNTISEAEKAKLTALGYIVTENTVPSDPRYGAGDLPIGFQVALNQEAAKKAMVIGATSEGGFPVTEAKP